MFLALREIRHAKLRFALITGVIVMVSSLVFILSGLSNGLATGNSAAIDALPVDGMFLSRGSDYQLDRSRLSMDAVEQVKGQDAVDDAAPFGASAGNVAQDGEEDILGVSMLGVDPESFVAPEPAKGEPLGSDAYGIVIDDTLVKKGVDIGDVLVTEPGGVELTVVGSVNGRSYRLIPTLYLPIETWQEIQSQGNGSAGDTINAVLFAGTAEAPEGTMLASKTQIVENLPGYSEQSLTLMLIQVFLVIIAAGIVAAFFYIMTLQKMPELGVMKAIGTKTGYLVQSLLAQVVLLGLIGVVLGTAFACIVSLAIAGTVPFDLRTDQFLIYGSVLIVMAMAGTLLSLIRVVRVDPLDAINNAG